MHSPDSGSALFGQLMDNAISELFVFDAEDLRFLHVNRYARTNLGYSLDDLRQMTPLDIKPLVDEAGYLEILQAASNEEGHRFLTRHQRRDGSLYDAQIHLARSVLEERPVWVAMALDITDQLRAQEELAIQAESSEVLNRLLERSLGDSSIEALLEEAVDALTGTRWLATRPHGGAFLRQADGHYALIYERALPELELASFADTRHPLVPGMGPDGYYRLPVVVDGRSEAVIVLYLSQEHRTLDRERNFLDAVGSTLSSAIQRRRAQAALSASEELQRRIVEQAGDAIITANDRGLISSFNPAAERMFGHRSQDIIGQSLGVLMPAGVRNDHDAHLDRYLDTHQPRTMGRPRPDVALRADGSTFPIELSTAAIHLGDRIVFSGILRDVSTQRRTQAELVQAREAALAASRSKSAFLANMSHEIRTPLNGIIGMAEVCMDRATDPQVAEGLSTILGSGEALLRIVGDILDLSKVEAGKLTLESLPTSVGDVCEEVVQLLNPSAEQHQTRLTIELDPALPPAVLTDPTRLRQVLLNLVGNAIKFDRGGDVRLRARLQTQRDERVSILFEVEDHGIGIDPAVLPTLFEAFAQADQTTTRKFGGTGLGLAISRQLAELLGGSLHADSVLGQGSTFRMVLALTVPREGVTATPAVEIESLEGLRVLVAEDNAVNQRVVRMMLEGAGVQVTVVDNGLQAVEACATQTWDVVLMDHQMPVMDGLDATRQLRGRGYTGPIVALSAEAMPHQVQAARAAGMDDHLSKPVRRGALLQALQRATARGPELANPQRVRRGQRLV